MSACVWPRPQAINSGVVQLSFTFYYTKRGSFVLLNEDIHFLHFKLNIGSRNFDLLKI